MSLASLRMFTQLFTRFSASIGARLGLGFALLCLLTVFMAANSVWQSTKMSDQFNRVLDSGVPRLTQLQALSRELAGVNVASRDAVVAPDAKTAEEALARIEAGRSVIGDQIQKLQEMLKDADETGNQIAEELGAHSSGILITLLKFSRLHKSGQQDAARTMLAATVEPKMHALSEAVEKAQTWQVNRLERARKESDESARLSRNFTAGLLILSLAAAIGLAVGISRSVTRPVARVVYQAERIAAGDLTDVMQVDRSDEIGRLQQAIVSMQSGLTDLVDGIRVTSNSMVIASNEIASGSQHLSQRTDETVTSLQRTAHSMEHLTSTVRQSAEAARTANNLAATAANAATHGNSVVAQVVTSMGDISASSKRIADITGVIDGIAFQTNILALNAAVEAARAGEHGKGFAVVAAEVRNLAQRSATAAREIKNLIGGSTQTVESGSKLVGEAGRAMREIEDGVQRVTAIINNISASASEQSTGLELVNSSVVHLDNMTQSNAALVEQSTAAAESLRQEAHNLQALVNRFRLHE